MKGFEQLAKIIGLRPAGHREPLRGFKQEEQHDKICVSERYLWQQLSIIHATLLIMEA